MNISFAVTIVINRPSLSQERFDVLLSLVSKERQDRIKRFRSFQDAQNCLLGEVLARSEICRMSGADNGQIAFSANEYGKPFLAEFPGIHFNISHSGQFIALAADSEPVGIDIERIKPYDAKIAKRFFTENENAYIISVPENLRSKRFFEIWTKKEAYIKHAGEGLHKPLPSFCVLDSGSFGMLPQFGEAYTGKVYFHKVYDTDEAVCHVCCHKHEAPAVRVIGVDELEIR